jgi:class 3 adenylate cyclase
MGKFKPKYTIENLKDGYNFSLSRASFNAFNPSILDLGDISKDGERIDALAAIFDLEGFTSFTNQIDPHLVVPEYLSKFLDWLFKSVADEFFQRQQASRVVLWCKLPFFAKFLGDGVLFLWDTMDLDPIFIGNIVSNLQLVCEDYERSFFPKTRKSMSRVPLKLRCGIARGQIMSIGDALDFVGPCINVAARLQKLGKFSFAFSKRGFELQKHFTEASQKDYALIKSQIRGLGDEELLFVLKRELEKLPANERKKLLP